MPNKKKSSRLYFLCVTPLPFFTLAIFYIITHDLALSNKIYALFFVAVVTASIEIIAIIAIKTVHFSDDDSDEHKSLQDLPSSPQSNTNKHGLAAELDATGEWVFSDTISNPSPPNKPLAIEDLGYPKYDWINRIQSGKNGQPPKIGNI